MTYATGPRNESAIIADRSDGRSDRQALSRARPRAGRGVQVLHGGGGQPGRPPRLRPQPRGRAGRGAGRGLRRGRRPPSSASFTRGRRWRGSTGDGRRTAATGQSGFAIQEDERPAGELRWNRCDGLIREVPDFRSGDSLQGHHDAAARRRRLSARSTPLPTPIHDPQRTFVVGIEAGAHPARPSPTVSASGSCRVRKPGKLPWRTTRSRTTRVRQRHARDHEDALAAGQRALIVDDLLATGGTAQATVALVKRCGAQVAGLSFLVELTALDGRGRLAGERVVAALQY